MAPSHTRLDDDEELSVGDGFENANSTTNSTSSSASVGHTRFDTGGLRRRHSGLAGLAPFLAGFPRDYKAKMLQGLDKAGLGVLRRSPKEIFASTMSGVINTVMLYSFSSIFSMILFSKDEYISFFVPEGVSLHLIATILSGLITICFSHFVIAISCPDINPVLLFLEVVKVLHNNVKRPEELLPTVLTASFINTMGIACICLILGYTKQVRLLQFVPATVMMGFLGIIGYKVTKEAFEIAAGEYAHHPSTWGFWKLALSGLAVGCPLYFTKRYHLGDPVNMFILFLLIPLIFFYIMLSILGMDIHEARESGWFLEEFGTASFYAKWNQVSFRSTNAAALKAALPTFFTNWIITMIDCLLKMAGIKRVTEIDASFDRETKLIGYMNILTGACFSSPAYPQMKWTALNMSIIRNATDRFPGILVVFLSLILYFSGFALVNFLPRFFLSGLLFYAGLPFLFENLFDSYWRLSRKEFFAVWVIVLMAVFGSTLIAVTVGVALATTIYVMQSARQKVQKAHLDLSSYQSKVTRSLSEELILEHLGGIGRILWLKHYLFFGSASKALEIIKEILSQRAVASVATRVQYLVVDFEEVDGIDYSAMAVFLDIAKRLAKSEMRAVVFTGLSNKLFNKFKKFQVLDYVTKTLPSVDEGAEYVEEQILSYYAKVRQRWLSLEPVRVLHEQSLLRSNHMMLDQMLGHNVSHELWHHVKQEKYEAGTVICKSGDYNNTLYLVQMGRVSLYAEIAGKRKRRLMVQRGAFLNEQSLFSNLPSEYTIEATTDCALLALSPESFNALATTQPFVALEIQRKVMQSASVRFEKAERELQNVHGGSTFTSRSNRRHLLNAIHKKMIKTNTNASQWLQKTVNRLFMFHKPLGGNKGGWGQLEEDDEIIRGRGGLATAPMGINGASSDQAAATPAAASADDPFAAGRSPQAPLSAGAKSARKRARMINLQGDGSAPMDGDDGFPTELVHIRLPARKESIARRVFREHCAAHSSQMETLPLKELQSLLLEIGFYVSELTIRSILSGLGDQLAESDLINLLKRLTLEPLTLEQQTLLLRKYRQFNDGSLEQPMNGVKLQKLMEELGNSLDENELVSLFQDWAPHGLFTITYLEFLGIMSMYMKKAALEEAVEDLFSKMANGEEGQHIIDLSFVAEDVQRVFSEINIRLSLDEADEMVFDASPDNSGEVNFDDWYDVITSIQENSVNEFLALNEVRLAATGGAMPTTGGERTPLLGSGSSHLDLATAAAAAVAGAFAPLVDLTSPVAGADGVGTTAVANRAGGNLRSSPSFMDESTI